MSMGLTIAGYCRISVDTELDRDNTSIENQKEIIQQYQEKRASLNADIDSILAQITDIITFIVPCLCRI